VVPEDNKKQLLVPVGFAHGFATLSEIAEVQYKQTNFYAPATEGTLLWNDPDVGIVWPVDDPILSQRDHQGTRLREYRTAPAFP
jgi:dTDP-4-dehydrorhamnose 3,5-epimerase